MLYPFIYRVSTILLVVQDFATIHSIMEIAMHHLQMENVGPWLVASLDAPRKTGWNMVRFQPESTWINQRSAKLSGFLDISAIIFHGAMMCHGQLVRFHPRSLWCHESGNSGNPPMVHHPDHQYHQTRIASSTGPLFTLFVSTWGHWHVSGTVDRRWAGGSEALGLLGDIPTYKMLQGDITWYNYNSY